MSKTEQKPQSNFNPGVIRAGEAYPVVVFLKLVGTTRHGLAAMKLKGLRTVTVNRKVWIRGEDWIEFLGTQNAA